MKKTFFFLLFNVFLFAFALNVDAATYQADELIRGQHFEPGDVLEFGSGVLLHEFGSDISYNTVTLNFDGYTHPEADTEFAFYVGESYTFSFDCYFWFYNGYGSYSVGGGRVYNSIHLWIDHNEPPVESDESVESDDEEENEQKETEDDEIPNVTPQVPSTLPTSTVQISAGTDGLYANIKALNQFPHDSVNQKILSDLYAASQKKRSSILMQKNLIPPYGVRNEWKTQSHTVRWKDLAVKKGDSIVIIWYTPMFGLHAPTLKYIPATVVEDGTIEFTIPAMGDMSVMSIVKLI